MSDVNLYSSINQLVSYQFFIHHHGTGVRVRYRCVACIVIGDKALKEQEMTFLHDVVTFSLRN